MVAKNRTNLRLDKDQVLRDVSQSVIEPDLLDALWDTLLDSVPTLTETTNAFTGAVTVGTTLGVTGAANLSGNVTLGAGVKFTVQALAADTGLTLDAGDCVIRVTSGSTTPNAIALPASATSIGQVVVVAVEDGAGTQACTVTRDGTDVIAGGAAANNTVATLADTGDFVALLCVASGLWITIGEYGVAWT